MHIVNRTLNIMIMLSAAAVCIFAWQLHKRRLELRDRADLLARKIHEAAGRVDENSPVKVADRLGCDADGGGGIGWKDHHENRNRTMKSLNEFVDAVNSARKQRDNLGGKLVQIARRLELASVRNQDLNDPDKSDMELARLAKTLGVFLARDQALREDLVKVHALVGKNVEPNPDSLKDIKRCRAASTEVIGAIERLQLHLGRHQVALAKLTQAIGSAHFPGVESGDLKELNPDTVQSLIASARTVSEQLAERELLKQQVGQLTAKIQQHAEALDTAKDELTRRNTVIKTLDEKVSHLEEKIRILTIGTPKAEGARYDGKVVKVNYDYNYLIISYEQGKDKLHPGLTLTVARDREYICQARISKIYKRYAVAEIPETDGVGTVMEGDRVVLLD